MVGPWQYGAGAKHDKHLCLLVQSKEGGGGGCQISVDNSIQGIHKGKQRHAINKLYSSLCLPYSLEHAAYYWVLLQG